MFPAQLLHLLLTGGLPSTIDTQALEVQCFVVSQMCSIMLTLVLCEKVYLTASV